RSCLVSEGRTVRQDVYQRTRCRRAGIGRQSRLPRSARRHLRSSQSGCELVVASSQPTTVHFDVSFTDDLSGAFLERHKTQKFGRKAISEVPEMDHCPRICRSDGQFRMSVIARGLVSGTMTFIRNRSPIGANWPRRGLSPNGGGSKRNSGRDDENV